MYCNNCGAKNPDNSKFCSACGTKLYTQDEPQALSNSNQLFTVEIFRESQMFLINPPINLSVVGESEKKTVSIANGETVQIDLPLGTYEFTFFQSVRKKVLKINLNQNVHIDLKWNRLTGKIETSIE